MTKHRLQEIRWGVMAITSYRGCLVTKIIGGYKCLNQKAKSPQEVDAIIDKSLTEIKKSIK